MPVVWLDLPSELWEQIYLQLDDLRDLVSFRAVCSLFRSIALQKQPSNALLMHPADDNYSGIFRFFSLSNCKLYSMHLPEVLIKNICGSFYGWLLTFDLEASALLLNPLSGAHISLPSCRLYFPRGAIKFFIDRATISITPSTGNDFIVMIIVSILGVLAYCKPGDNNWTPIFSHDKFKDVIYYKMKFYVIDNDGCLFALDFCDNEAPIVKEIISSSPKNEIDKFSYLVESLDGDLLMVERILNNLNETITFKVFKLDDYMKKWIMVESLTDQALFLGRNRPICLSASVHMEFKANCIHFMDDCGDRSNEAVYGTRFSLEDGTIKRFYKIAPFQAYNYIWITPSLG